VGQHPPSNRCPFGRHIDIIGNQSLERDSRQRLGEDICKVLVGGHALRCDDLLVGEFPCIVAANTNMLVGLVVHRIEHQRNNTRVVNKQRHGGVLALRIELVEQIHHPMSFLCSHRQGGVLGVIGGGSHEGVQFAVPGQNGAAEVENIPQRALQSA
jgi:hypothetical protein